MGNDGGSIPKRRELVKEAAKDPTTTQTKEIQNEQQDYYWAHCALSNQPLSVPVVSDALGRLYNKDAVLESLIANGSDNADYKPEGNPISSLRDVVEVKFHSEVELDVKGVRQSSASKWVCPTTNKTLGPGVKAVYLVPCGHAFSESAVKEISGDACLQCNETYKPDDVIAILPMKPTDKDRLKSRMSRLKEQGLTHSLKKAPGVGKKRKKNGTANGTISAEAKVENEKSSFAVQPDKHTANVVDGIRNAGTASLTAKVLAEQENRNKRRKTVENENLKGLFSSSNGEMKMHADFMTRGFSIPAGAKR